MFIEYDEAFVWQCDGCGHIAAFKPHDFYACVAELRARGWGFGPPEKRGEDDWTHQCGRCRQEYQRTNIMDRTLSRPREVKG